jgi:hypothetical protein
MTVIKLQRAVTKEPTVLRTCVFIRGVFVGVFLSILLARITYSIKSLAKLTASIHLLERQMTNDPFVDMKQKEEEDSVLSHSVVECSLSHNTTTRTTTTTTSAQSYSWIGNHWRPPAGVPLYSPRDMRDIFSQENILWIGDSTGRQDYVTLYNMLVPPAFNNSKDHNIHDIAVSTLNHGINVNKQGKVTEPCQKQQRKTLKLLLCRKTGNDKGYNYDYTEKICLNEVLNLVTTNQNVLTNSYSTIIISVGIWDVVRMEYCGRQNVTYVVDVLDVLEKQLCGTNVQIYWKVHCGAEDENPDQMERSATIQKLTREWFVRKQQSKNDTANMHIIDLAIEMKGRTYGPSRLNGDIRPHVGPLARTLFIQMVTQAVVQNKKNAYSRAK